MGARVECLRDRAFSPSAVGGGGAVNSRFNAAASRRPAIARRRSTTGICARWYASSMLVPDATSATFASRNDLAIVRVCLACAPRPPIGWR